MKPRTISHFGRSKSYPKDRPFSIKVSLQAEEVFNVSNVHQDMKIYELKGLVEFACGIPYHLQKLHYLDDADLLDHTDIKMNDIVPGATLQLEVWHMWRTLVEAVASNDIDWVFKLGVTQDTDYRTPNLDHMGLRSRQIWLAERAFVALYMAAHRGHIKMVERLIAAGADVNAKTPLGRTPLHVAASHGNGKIIDLLLEKGADINETDNDGNTALSIATKFRHKDCERHLFLFQWQQRANSLKPEFTNIPRMAHQYHDSAFPVWLTGEEAQLYFSKILPPEEFEGTMFHSPKRRHRPSSAPMEKKLQKEVVKKEAQAEDIQVEIGKETLVTARKEADANTPKTYLQSLLSRGPSRRRDQAGPLSLGIAGTLPKESTDSDVKMPRTRRLPNDVELYGLVEIEDTSAREKLLASQFGKQREYAMALSMQRQKTPKSFDVWLKEKRDKERKVAALKKAAEDEKKRMEEDNKKSTSAVLVRHCSNSTRMPVKPSHPPDLSKRKRADSAKKKSYETWVAQKEKEVKAAAVTGNKSSPPDDEQDVMIRIKNLLRSYQENEMSAYDQWLMRKEVESLEKMKKEDVVL